MLVDSTEFGEFWIKNIDQTSLDPCLQGEENLVRFLKNMLNNKYQHSSKTEKF